jgi:Domain of unknown function (DUF5655)
MPPSSRSASLQNHFQGREPHVAATYEALLKAVRRLGPVTEDPKKTSIHLVHGSALAGVATQKSALILTLKSRTKLKSPRIRKQEQVSTNRWHLEVRLTQPGDIDPELCSWLAAAYELAAG